MLIADAEDDHLVAEGAKIPFEKALVEGLRAMHVGALKFDVTEGVFGHFVLHETVVKK
jgi:hypothetical protein